MTDSEVSRIESGSNSEANDSDFELLGNEGCKSVWHQLRASEGGRMLQGIECESLSSKLILVHDLLFSASEKDNLHGTEINWRVCVDVVEGAMKRNPIKVLCAFYKALIDTKDRGGATQHAIIAERLAFLALDLRKKNDQGLPHGTMASEQHDGATVQHMMDKWRRDALVNQENDLKMHLGLTEVMDLLERPAGGFMTVAERKSVEKEDGPLAQVGKIIKILRSKGNEEFGIFLEILRKSGNEVWASCLAKTADLFQQEYANCELSFSIQESQAPDRQTMEEGYIHNMRHSVCTTPPGGDNSAPAYASTQLPQSPSKHSVYLQPSMDRGNYIMLPPMPVDLQVISSILLEQKVYITGIATDPESRCVLVYSLNESRWSKLKVAPNYNAPTTVISGHITLIGGRVSEDKLTNLVCSWIDGEWKQIVPPMPKQRMASGVCHNDGLLLVMGGVEDTNQTEPVDTVVVYIVSRNEWVTVRALQLPKGLRSHHVVMFKEYLYLVGGGDAYPTPPQYGVVKAWRARWDDIRKVSVEAADEQGVQTHTPEKEPSQDVKEAVNEAEDAPKEGEHTRTAEEEPSKSVWSGIADLPVVRPTVVSSKDSLMVVGGANKCGIPQKGIYEFVDDDSLGSWNLVGNMSVGRCRHAVVPLGRRCATLFVAGGYVPESKKENEGSIMSSSAELVAL